MTTKRPLNRKNNLESTRPLQDAGNPGGESTCGYSDGGNPQGTLYSDNSTEGRVESDEGDRLDASQINSPEGRKSTSSQSNYMSIKEQRTLEPLYTENVFVTGPLVTEFIDRETISESSRTHKEGKLG